MRPLPGLTQASDTSVTSASYQQIKTQGFMIQLIRSNLESLASFTGGRDLQKKAPACSRSCICQNQYTWLPLPRPRFFPGSWLPSGDRCWWPSSTCRPATVTAPKPRIRKPAPGSVKTEARVPSCSMSQSLPHTSLASPLRSCMSLGKLQGFLPKVTNSPNPNQQSCRPPCFPQLAGG